MTTTDELVERVARAICDCLPVIDYEVVIPYDELTDADRADVHAAVRAAIAAVRAHDVLVGPSAAEIKEAQGVWDDIYESDNIPAVLEAAARVRQEEAK